MSRLKWLLTAAVVLIVAAGGVLYLQLFRDTWQSPTVVVIESDDEVTAMFPSYMAWQTAPEEDGKQALLLRDGDYFMSEPHDALIRYLTSDGPALRLASASWSLSLNGDVVSLSLSEEEALAWLAGATDEQLVKLRIVDVPGDAGPEVLAALKRVSAVNPHLDLQVGSAQVLHSLLEYFQPRAVFAENESEGLLAVMGGQPELETLLIDASEPGSLDYLPKLPRLRRLVLGSWDPEKAGPLPAGLEALESLITVESKLSDLSALAAAPAGLEELSFSFQDEFVNLGGIEKMSNLRTLILMIGDEDAVPSMPDLAALPKLRWLGLPFGTSQQQLAAIVKSNPRVEILALPKTEKTLDLAPLGELKRLRGLVLGGVYENLEVVQTLKSLRFLGISKESWPDSPEEVAEIRAALPDAVVIRVEPFCLGSGWLLLFLPLLGSAWLQHERRHRPASAA